MKTKKFYGNWLVVIVSITYIGMFWLFPLLYNVNYWEIVIGVHLIIFGGAGIVVLMAYLVIKYEES